MSNRNARWRRVRTGDESTGPAWPASPRRRRAGRRAEREACGLHVLARATLRAARPAGALALLLIAAWAPCKSRAAAASPVAASGVAGAPAGFFPPLVRPPLDPPLVLTGGYGEYRGGHFHAGLDLGTGERVGKPVFAPLAGWIERVRASGAGYGRSIYLHAEDGRLLQFGHLDAFDEPLASYVAAVQESSGRYEQDLWPAVGRFRVAAGQRIAWSGESGAGGPHLHFEVRRGDVAYNPMRAGLEVPDPSPPSLVTLTLEPLDDASFVEGAAAPYTLRLGARPDTLTVEGRVRAVVGARDGTWHGVDRMVPWSVGLAFGDVRVECRFDSLSWATDMPEVDYVYDSGRVTGGKGLVLWAPAGFRPRVLLAEGPGDGDAGTLRVAAGDPPRALRLAARDLGGGEVERTVVLRPPPAGSVGPDTTRVGPATARPAAGSGVTFAALPGHFLRATCVAPAGGSREVWFEMRGGDAGRFRATLSGGAWSAVMPLREYGREHRLSVSGRSAGRSWSRSWKFTPQPVSAAGGSVVLPGAGFSWTLPAGGAFEPAAVWTWEDDGGGAAELGRPLARVGIEPATMPLARAAEVTLDPGRRAPDEAGLYVSDDGGWDFLSTQRERGRLAGRSRQLGTFGALVDTLAPRVTPLAAPARGRRAPYSRWALSARIVERGSGIDASASSFIVDGRRVPTEWDAEARVLRWRPLRAPAAGTHRYVVIATDRAGNTRRRSGRFVLD